MRTAMVAGGSGGIGEGVVRAFLGLGWQVVVPSRRTANLETLKQDLGSPARLTLLEGNVVDPDDATDLKNQLLEHFGRLDALVVSVGGWWQGQTLLEVDIETWETQIRRILTSHFLIARTFLPALIDSGRNPSATFIGGSASEDPVPGAGPTCVAGAGQIMLVRALAKELADSPVRINELILGPVATRKTPDPDPTWISADDVGTACAALATETSTRRGEVIHMLDKKAFLGLGF